MLIYSTIIYPHWKNFRVAFEQALKPLNINPDMHFLPELVLLAGDLDKSLKVTDTKFGRDVHEQFLILQIMLTQAELNFFLENFRRKYPRITLRNQSQNNAIEESQRTLMFSLNEMVADIIPLIATLTTEHPVFLKRHQDNAHQVSYIFHNLLSKYNICTHQSDVVEETICRVVQRYTLNQFLGISRQFFMHFLNLKPGLPTDAVVKILEFCGLPIIENSQAIRTNVSLYQANENDPSYLQLYLSLAIDDAKVIQNYFNDLVPESTYIDATRQYVPEKDSVLTIINVKSSALIHPVFLKQFEDVLYTDSENMLVRYQAASNHGHGNVEPKSQEKIVLLDQAKEGLLQRNSIFRNHLARIEATIQPWVDVVKPKPVTNEAAHPDDKEESIRPAKRRKAYS